MAESSGSFYKIIRRTDDPLQDLDDPVCIDTASREFADMRFLHGISDRICPPERNERACIVYPLLSGPDMREVLLDKRARAQHESCLREAMELLARLHQRADGLAQYPVKDYRCDSFVLPDPGTSERMKERKRTLVVTGFEARNFRFDAGKAAWFFFDPHHLWQGLPEEDFARFLISLLMIKGRRRGFRPWKDFDRSELLAMYEESAPTKLDAKLLNYFLHEQLAKRRFHAMKAIPRMGPPAGAFVRTYTDWYYRRLQGALESQKF